VLLASAAVWAGAAASIAPSVATAAVTLSPGRVPPPNATPPGTARLGIYLYSIIAFFLWRAVAGAPT
jgi:hypothetical protein